LTVKEKQMRRCCELLSALLVIFCSLTLSAQQITGSVRGTISDLAQDPFNLGAERGRSMFDARHRLVLSYQWSLPWFHQAQTWYEHVLGN